MYRFLKELYQDIADLLGDMPLLHVGGDEVSNNGNSNQSHCNKNLRIFFCIQWCNKIAIDKSVITSKNIL